MSPDDLNKQPEYQKAAVLELMLMEELFIKAKFEGKTIIISNLDYISIHCTSAAFHGKP